MATKQPVVVTQNDLIEALRATTGPPEPEGEGWMRVNAIAAALGLERSATRARLARAVKNGTAETVKCGGVAFYRKKAV